MVHGPSRSRRWAVGVGLVLAAGGAAAAMAATAQAGESTHEPGPVIVCESGVVSHGDVQTSSAVAVRVTAGTPVPDGCRDG